MITLSLLIKKFLFVFNDVMRICVDLRNSFNRINVKLLLLDLFQLMKIRPVLTQDEIQSSEFLNYFLHFHTAEYCLEFARFLSADEKQTCVEV